MAATSPYRTDWMGRGGCILKVRYPHALSICTSTYKTHLSQIILDVPLTSSSPMGRHSWHYIRRLMVFCHRAHPNADTRLVHWQVQDICFGPPDIQVVQAQGWVVSLGRRRRRGALAGLGEGTREAEASEWPDKNKADLISETCTQLNCEQEIFFFGLSDGAEGSRPSSANTSIVSIVARNPKPSAGSHQQPPRVIAPMFRSLPR